MVSERSRFDLIDQEQLAAQMVAVMSAHFQRPTAPEKLRVLDLAIQQVRAEAEAAETVELARPDLAGEAVPQ
jgi:hypothetical protein